MSVLSGSLGPLGMAAGKKALWTPAAFAPAVWLAADVISGKSNGDSIPTWADSSGNGLTGAGSGTTYASDGMGSGKPGVAFTAGRFTFGPLPLTAHNSACFVAALRTTNTAPDSNFSFPGAALVGDTSGGVYTSWGLSGGKLCETTYSNAWVNAKGGSSVADGATHIVATTHDYAGGAIRHYVDGALDGSGSIICSGLGYLQANAIGTTYGNNGLLSNLTLGELLIFDQIPDASTLASLFAYMARW